MTGKVVYVQMYVLQGNGIIEAVKDYCIYRHYGIDVGDGKVIFFGNSDGESILTSRILLATGRGFPAAQKFQSASERIMYMNRMR